MESEEQHPQEHLPHTKQPAPEQLSTDTPVPESDSPSRLPHILIAGVLILALAGLAGFIATRNSDSTDTSPLGQNSDQRNQPQRQTDSRFLRDYLDRCEETEPAFTSLPLKASELGYIEPLGKMSDGHVTPTDHLYVAPINPSVPANTYAVLMPADGIIVQVDKMSKQKIGDVDSGEKTIPEDHRVTISHSCRYFSIFIHIHALSDSVKQQVGELDWGTQKRTNIKLRAGDTIGFIGGNAVDWTLLDTSTTLPGFISPARYLDESWKIHTVDPTDVYQGPLRELLIAKSLRSAEPWGGKIDYDQPGKLIGTWFREGSGNYFGDQNRMRDPSYRYWDGHLSIAPDYIDHTTTVFSIGNWEGMAQQFTVKGSFDAASINRQSGPVKLGLLRYNYSLADGKPWSDRSTHARGMKLMQTEELKGTALVEVLDGEKLKVELFPGKSANQVTGFTSAAMMYDR
jgi:hypothetical protein